MPLDLGVVTINAKEPLMKKDNVKLTEDQEAQLLILENMPDDQIDTSDIPETIDWTGGRRGVFYQPSVLFERLDCGL